MDLYEKIKLLASEKKMSIRQLEETLGFGNGVINRWRKNTPGSDKLKKVADYFNVSVDYLLGRTDNIKDTDSKIQRPKVKMLARKMDKLDDSQLDAIDGLIDNFFDKKFNKKD
ncbi:TPA: helix-turn-helix transcriptional regulator [Enterococcus faecalis]|nr:helix-turn-helix transcriptional regulator [Enterococcus faecalis]